MDNAHKQLIHFLQSAGGFGAFEKIKLIVFAAGLKKAAFVRLKISPRNLECKSHFEKHLRECRIPFIVSHAKTYEEISAVKRNKVMWKPAGIWFGYDVFADKKTKELFMKYLRLKHNDKHSDADRIGARIYGYPACCQKQYTLEHDLQYIKRHYSYFEFYKKVHDVDWKLPFIFHIPCSANCRKSSKMNELHKKVVRKYAPGFYESFVAREGFVTDVIVDSFSDITDDYGRSIWQRKDGYDAALITKKKIKGNYYMLSYLSKKELQRGLVCEATLTTQYDTAEVKLGRKKGMIKNLHHRRKFYIP